MILLTYKLDQGLGARQVGYSYSITIFTNQGEFTYNSLAFSIFSYTGTNGFTKWAKYGDDNDPAVDKILRATYDVLQ